MNNRILFLSWDAPWPAYSGGALRGLGLLRELKKYFTIDLILLTRYPLTEQQIVKFNELADSYIRIPLKDVQIIDKLKALFLMVFKKYPYHSAILINSLRDKHDIRKYIESYPSIVFTSCGHWGSLIYDRMANNWILNQCDSDVEFWRVYASHERNPFIKIFALINWILTIPHYKKIYKKVGSIISVCEEDKIITSKYCPFANIDVIENGIDCTYYIPNKESLSKRPPRILFTGTSAMRNITALRWFTKKVFPMVKREVPDVELLVAGDFNIKSQKIFYRIPNINFTGRVDDIRCSFDQSDIYIAPFKDAHGSKLKIAEAMAMAMPIVSTPAGVRGFNLENGESVFMANTSDSFASKCVELLKDATLREKIGKAAREKALKTIDWQLLGEKINSIVNEQKRILAIPNSIE